MFLHVLNQSLQNPTAPCKALWEAVCWAVVLNPAAFQEQFCGKMCIQAFSEGRQLIQQCFGITDDMVETALDLC